MSLFENTANSCNWFVVFIKYKQQKQVLCRGERVWYCAWYMCGRERGECGWCVGWWCTGCVMVLQVRCEWKWHQFISQKKPPRGKCTGSIPFQPWSVYAYYHLVLVVALSLWAGTALWMVQVSLLSDWSAHIQCLTLHIHLQWLTLYIHL